IITAINLIGGVVLGVTHGLSLAEAATTYSILTIGDGLASQLPALMIATTAGLLTTKADTETAIGSEIGQQLFAGGRPLTVALSVLLILAILPGVPTLPVLALAAIAALRLRQRQRPPAEQTAAEGAPDDDAPPTWDEGRQLREFLLTDRAIVEVGPGLAGLLNSRRPKSLPERITNLRREFSQSRGLWIPPLRVRANLDLSPSLYRILIAGREVATGTLWLDRHLAILPEQQRVNLPGETTEEPVFRLPAKWIDPAIARQAELQGCTVVDPTSVLLTHLGEVLQEYGHELLTRETLKQLLDTVHEFAPTVIDELKSETIRTGLIHQVLVQLAEDRIPLADLALILESILNHAASRKSPDELVDAVRQELGQLVCAQFQDGEGAVRVIALQPQLEGRLRESLQPDGQLALPPPALEALIVRLSDLWRQSRGGGREVALLLHHTLRRPVRRLLRRALPGLGFVAYREISAEARISPVEMLRLDQVYTDAPSSAAVSTDSEATINLAVA
ncbi:MAG: FHIPEP family type III secretion protein, partial [Planctomycetaceae bacterium]|nr:FHIPEP family type III secretion protein [Planctomycetaceae bacterium]